MKDRALTVPSIKVSGTPFEAGKAKGASVRMFLANKCRYMVNEHHSQEWISRLLSRAEQSLKRTGEYFSAVVEEIEGVAAGGGIPVEYAAALFSANDVPPSGDECTNVVFARTPDGPVWGGNADGCLFPMVELRDVSGAYRSVIGHGNITGLVGGYGGINEHGLALGSSGISPGQEGGRIPACYRVDVDHTQDAAEPLAICPQIRLMLDLCKTVDEAVEFLSRPEVRGQGNCAMVDETGKSAVVERAGRWLYVWPGTEEGSFCGNLTRSMLDRKVYDAPDEEVYAQDDPPHWPGIWGRYRAAEDAVTKHADKHSLDFMKQTMRSHEGDITRTCTICSWSNNASYIAVCRERKFLAAMAPPCQNPYVEFAVPGCEGRGTDHGDLGAA